MFKIIQKLAPAPPTGLYSTVALYQFMLYKCFKTNSHWPNVQLEIHLAQCVCNEVIKSQPELHGDLLHNRFSKLRNYT